MSRCMRTTLTLDPDVAALLDRLREQRKASLKDVVNEGLRRGLKQMSEPVPRAEPYRTRSVDLGRCLVDSIDNIAEVISFAEGDDHK